MIKNTIKIEGMMCGMCEAHIADAIRKAFPQARKVSASRKKSEAVFLTENAADTEILKNIIESTGYHFMSCSSEQYGK